LLFVGPRGAGARPGPACYGYGAAEPTVTDAQVVLGRLGPGEYAGGALTIDARLAEEAVQRNIAEPLGLSLRDAAAGIVRVMEQNVLHAVSYISVQRGLDPRRFVLVAGGGAGGLHGAIIGRLLGSPKV
jgi:N-methylhydantoinase A